MTLLDQLKRDEGLRLTPYKDSVGKVTIGYGRNLDDVGISQYEAEILLQHDLIHASQVLRDNLPWTEGLDEVRRAVLVNMSFNMGIHGLMGFKNTLGLIQAGEFDQASEAMLQSKWAEQVGPRAHRLSLQLKTGDWQ
jgi:lysozyme